MRNKDEMTQEDLARVENYLSSPVHQVERGDFKGWHLFAFLTAVLIALGGLAIFLAINAGAWNQAPI